MGAGAPEPRGPELAAVACLQSKNVLVRRTHELGCDAQANTNCHGLLEASIGRAFGLSSGLYLG